MRVFVVQTNPQENKSENLENALSEIKKATTQGADVVVLPEMFTFMGQDSDRFENADELGKGVFSEISNWARQNNVYLIGGSHGEKPSQSDEPLGKRVFNTNQCFARDGSHLSTYRKLHLFNLRSRSGLNEFKESDHYLEGKPPKETFCIKAKEESWKALTLICYDLRFPEVFRQECMRLQPPDVIFIPSAFTYRTGQAHWEVLLRARAIENQCYVVACNQTGSFSKGTKRNYGHSMIVSPWGEVLLNMGEEVGVNGTEISLKEVHLARSQIPALENRKLFS